MMGRDAAQMQPTAVSAAASVVGRALSRVAQAVGKHGLEPGWQVATERIAHVFGRPEFLQPLFEQRPQILAGMKRPGEKKTIVGRLGSQQPQLCRNPPRPAAPQPPEFQLP